MANAVTSPVQVTSLGKSVAEGSASLGSVHTCALKTDGSLWCWGGGSSGQIGNGATTSVNPTPVQVTTLGTVVRQVAAGGAHTCAVKTDGTLWCWGYNKYGQVGDGTTNSPITMPVQVQALGNSVLEVRAGAEFTCAKLADRTVKCWGNNLFGQLGDGTVGSFKMTPAVVSSLSGVDAIKAGAFHACARIDSQMWCWGHNQDGEVTGDGTKGGSTASPVKVAGIQGRVDGMSLGQSFTCAHTENRKVWCWGANRVGQIGIGSKMLSIPLSAEVIGCN
jgi:alpha-tubulin suppressor-like RCC1 family protein